MRGRGIIAVFFATFLGVAGFASAAQLQSINFVPQGSYPACARGTIFYSSSTDQFMLCTSSGGQPSPLVTGASNSWTLSGSSLYPSSTGYNVGIGTTNPGANKLYVGGYTAANPGIHLYTTDTSNQDYGLILDGPTNAERAIGFFDNGSAAWWFGRDNTGDVNTGIGFWRSGTNFAFVIRDNGYVGVNTSSPATNLDVNGNIQSAVYYDRDNTNYYIDAAANVMPYSALFAGNVGIGTTAPESSLHIEKNNDGGLGADLVIANKGGSSANTAVAIDFGVDNSTAANGAGNAQIKVFNTGTSNQGAMTFSTYNGGGDGFQERMHIAPNGNVGIGTTNPGYKLDVNGVVQANATFRTPSVAFAETNRRAKDSSNVDIETVYGWQGNSSGKTFLQLWGFAPPTMYRTTGDMPAPYGIGFSNGSESGGIMPIGQGDNLQEIMFYGSNSGPTTFTWKHQVWESSTYDPSYSNYYSAPAMSLNANTGLLYVAGNVGIGMT